VPGDTISVRVANAADGIFSACTSARIPLPSRIADVPRHPPVTPGQTRAITGILTDAGLADEGDVPITLAASAGAVAPLSLRSDADGRIEVDFTAPAVAGPVTITGTFPGAPHAIPPVTWTVPVAPVVLALEPAHGDVAGGTAVTITGAGFVDGHTRVSIGGVDVIGAVDVVSSTELHVHAPAGQGVGPAPVVVTVSGIDSAPGPDLVYVVPFGPFMTFEDKTCGTATLDADVFDHDGRPVIGEPVTLTATEGRFRSDGTLVATWTSSTGAAGRIVARMVTADAQATQLGVAAHTDARPSPDETASTLVMSSGLCDTFRNFHRRDLKYKVSLGEILPARIVDGCLACADRSKYRVDWKPSGSELRGLVVTALTDDAATAASVDVAVLGPGKAKAILDRSPLDGDVLSLVDVRGKIGTARVTVTQEAGEHAGTLAVYRLTQGKWVRVESALAPGAALQARVSSAGIHAIVASVDE
jgi:hypothetical protein